MTLAEVAAALLILGTAGAALLVWDRYAVRAYERRQRRLEEASLEELLHPGDDCSLLVDEDLGVELEPPFVVDPEPSLLEEHIMFRSEQGQPVDLTEFVVLGTVEVPEIPRERLYDAGGMVQLGKLILHDQCKYLRREGRFDEICRECAPSLIGSAAHLPRRRSGPVSGP